VRNLVTELRSSLRHLAVSCHFSSLGAFTRSMYFGIV